MSEPPTGPDRRDPANHLQGDVALEQQAYLLGLRCGRLFEMIACLVDDVAVAQRSMAGLASEYRRERDPDDSNHRQMFIAYTEKLWRKIESINDSAYLLRLAEFGAPRSALADHYRDTLNIIALLKQAEKSAKNRWAALSQKTREGVPSLADFFTECQRDFDKFSGDLERCVENLQDFVHKSAADGDSAMDEALREGP